MFFKNIPNRHFHLFCFAHYHKVGASRYSVMGLPDTLDGEMVVLFRGAVPRTFGGATSLGPPVGATCVAQEYIPIAKTKNSKVRNFIFSVYDGK